MSFCCCFPGTDAPKSDAGGASKGLEGLEEGGLQSTAPDAGVKDIPNTKDLSSGAVPPPPPPPPAAAMDGAAAAAGGGGSTDGALAAPGRESLPGTGTQSQPGTQVSSGSGGPLRGLHGGQDPSFMTSQDAALADSLILDGAGGAAAGGGGGGFGSMEGAEGMKVFSKPDGEGVGAKPVEVQGAGGAASGGVSRDIAGAPAGVQEVE